MGVRSPLVYRNECDEEIKLEKQKRIQNENSGSEWSARRKSNRNTKDVVKRRERRRRQVKKEYWRKRRDFGIVKLAGQS